MPSWNSDPNLGDNFASHRSVPELSLFHPAWELLSHHQHTSRHGTNPLGVFNVESKIWSGLQPCHDYWYLGSQIAIFLDM